MCNTTIKISDQDSEYLGKVKDRMKLRSKAAVISLIIKMMKFRKLESELR